MSKAKFTKGPWVFCEDGHGRDIEITSQARIDDFKTTICGLDIYFDGYHGVEQKANANLIACAPEMYEMLEYVMRCAAMQDNQLIDANKIMALLAKARGEHDTNS